MIKVNIPQKQPMNSEAILFICGVYNFLFALFHIFFWRLFNWKNDLRKTSTANKAIIQILNLRLIYIFILMSVIYIFFSDELLQTNLGRLLLIGFAGFWFGRTIEQFIFLRIKSLLVHSLTAIFIIGTVLHLLPLFL